MDIALILAKNFYGKQWSLDGDEYSGLEWLDNSPKPTKKELEALWPELKYRLDYTQVENARRAAYVADCDPLFFGYQRGENTEQDWLDAVQAVKDAHPYPEVE